MLNIFVYIAISIAVLSGAVLFACPVTAYAQSGGYKTGDRVEVDVNMSSSPEYMKWQPGTITEISMWNGRVSGIHVKTDTGQTVTVAEKYLRRLKDVPKPAAKLERSDREPASQGEFKVGDRVEVDSIMANDAADSKWVKATVTAVDLKNGRYVVRRDDFNEMSVLIRPGKTWIRRLNDGSDAPNYPTCQFFKDYRKVSDTAAPSADLFKAVIFERYRSTSNFYDFGLVFEDLRMGARYTNRARGNGRKDVDAAPVGAVIYPLSTKLVFCEKDLNYTFRTEWTNEFTCFKDRFGRWTCPNGAPQNYKRSVGIPNELLNKP